MADIVDLGAIARGVAHHRRAAPEEAARFGGKQRCQEAQQARFAAAVAATQDQHPAGGQPAIEPGKDQSLAAPAG